MQNIQTKRHEEQLALRAEYEAQEALRLVPAGHVVLRAA